jgi:hypothetical protein
MIKSTLATLAATVIVVTGLTPALATDLKDKVRLEVSSVGLHPGMPPGMYVCAQGHLHIKGTAHNTSDVPLGNVKVAGKAFDADGKLLGTATSTTKAVSIAPHEKTEFNLEFLTVTGPRIKEARTHEVTVVEAPAKK